MAARARGQGEDSVRRTRTVRTRFIAERRRVLEAAIAPAAQSPTDSGTTSSRPPPWYLRPRTHGDISTWQECGHSYLGLTFLFGEGKMVLVPTAQLIRAGVGRRNQGTGAGRLSGPASLWIFTASTACVTPDPMKPNPVPAVTAPIPITTQPTGPDSTAIPTITPATPVR
jgi:hypothetical protein